MLLRWLPFSLRFDRYVVRTIALALLPVVLMLLALFSFLALAEELEDVGDGTYRAIDAVAVVGLTLPNRLLDLLPVMLLLGALVGLGGMAGNSELTAARAAGRSPLQLVRPPLLFALLVGLLLLLAAEFLVPAAEQAASQLRAKSMKDVSLSSGHTWTRSNQQIIKVGQIDSDGALVDVEIYQWGESGLDSVRQVRSAVVLDARHWLLEGVQLVEREFTSAAGATLAQELWQSDLTEDKLAALALPPASLSLRELRARILRSQANDLDVHALRVMLWQRLSLPLAAVAMMVLALPFVLGSTRSVSAGERVTFGIIAGVVFYLTEQAAGHTAVIYRLNPVVMAVAPEVLIILLVGNWLRRQT